MDGVRDPGALHRALGILIVGMLLVFVDLRVDGFDLLPDVVGWGLAAFALGRCRDAHGDDGYRSRITAAWVLALLCAAFAVLDLVGDPAPHLDWLVSVAQPVVTAFAFARLARVTGPDSLRRSWDTSIALLLGGLAVALVAIALEDSGFGVVAVVVVIAAAVHYLVSIWRTRTALNSPAGVR
jgi:uncharacterized membrane protein